MTRDVHARIEALKNSLSASSITMTTTNIPDAVRKLEQVMTMTCEATHKLLGMVSRFEHLLQSESSTFEKVYSSLMKVLPPEHHSILRDYAQEHAEYRKDANALLGEMVMSQEFQDLCGQSLAKILKLLREVQTEIAQLMQQFGQQVDSSSTELPTAEPLAQDGVDDILKEFGFDP
jgi:chemotaxis protein CheZ